MLQPGERHWQVFPGCNVSDMEHSSCQFDVPVGTKYSVMLQGHSAKPRMPGGQAAQVCGVSGVGGGDRAGDGASTRTGCRLPGNFGRFWRRNSLKSTRNRSPLSDRRYSNYDRGRGSCIHTAGSGMGTRDRGRRVFNTGPPLHRGG